MLDIDTVLTHPAGLPTLIAGASACGWLLVAVGDWLGRTLWRCIVWLIEDARRRQ